MADQGGGQKGLVWENESWAFSNSDNSGASGENHIPRGRKKLQLESTINNSKSDSPKQLLPTAETTTTGTRKRSNKRKGCGEGNEQGKGGTDQSDHEMHIWTERERRKRMRSMFASLHALLPQLPPKADKSTIVDEAVNYIKTLEHTLQKLQKQKLERLQGVTTISYDSSSLVNSQKLAMDSREAFMADQGSSSQSNNNSLCLSNPFPFPHYPAAVFRTWVSPNVILNICGDNAHINVCCPKRLGLFTAISYILEKNKLEVISAQVSSDHYRSMFMIQVQVNGALDHFPQSFSVEEIFQQAAGEIMSYISSL